MAIVTNFSFTFNKGLMFLLLHSISFINPSKNFHIIVSRDSQGVGMPKVLNTQGRTRQEVINETIKNYQNNETK